MDSSRRVLGFRIALSAAAAVLVLAGASLNASGRDSGGIALAGVTGLLAVSSGVLYREWRLAVPLAGIASVVTIVIAQFNALQGDLVPQVAGLVLLAVGGLAGARAPPGAFSGEGREAGRTAGGQYTTGQEGPGIPPPSTERRR